MSSFLKKNIFIFFILIFIALLRIPSIFEPYWYGDEGIYLTLGMGIKRGLLLYRDIFDNKPPLIYLLTALADGRLYWFRSMLFISSLVSTYLFYLLAKSVVGSGKTNNAVKISVFVFALLTTIRLFEGNIANAENFILLPAIWGYLFILRAKRDLDYLFSGLIFSVAFLFKVPALFDFSAAVFFLLLFKRKDGITFKKGISLGTGFIVPIALVSLYFLTRGAFGVYFNSVFLQTIGYLSSWETGSHAFNPISLLKSEFLLRSVLVLIFLAGLWKARKRISEGLALAGCWFLFALFAVSLSGRPYPHYLLQAVPAFALCLGIFIKEIKGKTLERTTPLLFFLLAGLVFWRYEFWIYKTIPYYQNFIEFSLGKKDKNEYFNYFNQRMSEIYTLSEFTKSITLPSEKIFIWANDPSIYPLSEKLPATPYTVAYHVKDLKIIDFVVEKLENDKTNLIIKDVKIEVSPQLEILLGDKYRMVKSIGDFVVYRRKGIDGN